MFEEPWFHLRPWLGKCEADYTSLTVVSPCVDGTAFLAVRRPGEALRFNSEEAAQMPRKSGQSTGRQFNSRLLRTVSERATFGVIIVFNEPVERFVLIGRQHPVAVSSRRGSCTDEEILMLLPSLQ